MKHKESIIMQVHSTYFGCQPHPSAVVHKTETTASGTGRIFVLQRGQASFRASLIYINNFPTRCNTTQSIYYSASSLYMFRVSTTPIIRSTQNSNYSLRYWSYFLCSYLPPTWPVPEAVVRVLCTPDDGCG